MSNFSVLLQAGAPGGSSMASLFLMVGMVVVMYFFMIRPQAKRAKEQKKFAESINEGEQVVTTAGIHGRIAKVNDNGTINLDLGRANTITIERSAVSMELTKAFRKRTNTEITNK